MLAAISASLTVAGTLSRAAATVRSYENCKGFKRREIQQVAGKTQPRSA